MAELIFALLNLVFAVYLLYYIVAFVSGAPFVPSTNRTADSMLKLAKLKKGMHAYDLGSGEGKLLLRIAGAGAKATGIEINPLLVLVSFIRTRMDVNRNLITVAWKSFWNCDLSDADAVFIYLLPLRMEKLEKKLMQECRKGTVIISNSFLFPHLKMSRQDTENHVYVYELP